MTRNIDQATAHFRRHLEAAAAGNAVTVVESGGILTRARPTSAELRESLDQPAGSLTATARGGAFTLTVTSSKLSARNLETATRAAFAVAEAAAGNTRTTTRETGPNASASPAQQPRTTPVPVPAAEPTDDHIDALLPHLDEPGGHRAMADLLATAYAPPQPNVATATPAVAVTGPTQFTDAEVDAVIPDLTSTDGRRSMQSLLGDHFFGRSR